LGEAKAEAVAVVARIAERSARVKRIVDRYGEVDVDSYVLAWECKREVK
jgi:hypothetical protein